MWPNSTFASLKTWWYSPFVEVQPKLCPPYRWSTSTCWNEQCTAVSHIKGRIIYDSTSNSILNFPTYGKKYFHGFFGLPWTVTWEIRGFQALESGELQMGFAEERWTTSSPGQSARSVSDTCGYCCTVCDYFETHQRRNRIFSEERAIKGAKIWKYLEKLIRR